MFWNMVSTNSTIEAVLDDPNVTLETVLEQDEVIQECRATNKRLLEYLQRPVVMFEMLDLITREPSADVELALQYKFSSISCEVLTSDISFAEKICAEKSFMDKLFHFFRDAGPALNPVLASYVCRTLGEIVTRNLDQNWYSYQLNIIQIMGYLTSEPNVLPWILCHLGTNAVCDLLYKVIMNVEGQDMRNNLFEWMERECFLTRLMEKMGGQETSETHANVNKLVGDLLFAFRDDLSSGTQDRSNDADPFLVALKSPQTLGVLMDTIFKDFPEMLCGSSVKNGLELTLAILGITKKPPKQRTLRRNSFAETNTDVNFDDQQRCILIPMLTKLDDLLKKPFTTPLKLTYGEVEEPIGPVRLAIANFIAQILSAHDNIISEHVASLPIVSTLMELFWSHPWNNFLHRHVAIVAIHLLNSRGPEAAARLVRYSGFVEKAPKLFEETKMKCGYRPYVATVASVWAQLQDEESSALEREMHDLSVRRPEETVSWGKFCWSILPEYDKKTLLGGVPKPNRGLQHNTSITAQYESDPGVDWDSNTFTSGQKCRFDSDPNDDFFGDDDKLNDDESAREMFDTLCIKKSDFGKEDDDLENSANSLGGATGDTIDFDFANFDDLAAFSENPNIIFTENENGVSKEEDGEEEDTTSTDNQQDPDSGLP